MSAQNTKMFPTRLRCRLSRCRHIFGKDKSRWLAVFMMTIKMFSGHFQSMTTLPRFWDPLYIFPGSPEGEGTNRKLTISTTYLLCTTFLSISSLWKEGARNVTLIHMCVFLIRWVCALANRFRRCLGQFEVRRIQRVVISQLSEGFVSWRLCKS